MKRIEIKLFVNVNLKKLPEGMAGLAKHIKDEKLREEALHTAAEAWEKNIPCGYDWSLSWLKIKLSAPSAVKKQVLR